MVLPLHPPFYVQNQHSEHPLPVRNSVALLCAAYKCCQPQQVSPDHLSPQQRCPHNQLPHWQHDTPAVPVGLSHLEAAGNMLMTILATVVEAKY
jgi:hypothetical protein